MDWNAGLALNKSFHFIIELVVGNGLENKTHRNDFAPLSLSLEDSKRFAFLALKR